MKVTLIYLPHPYLKQPDAQAPLGIMYLASSVREHGFEVEIKSYSSYLTYEAIADLDESDFYGISVTSLELPQANRFAHLIREKFPNAIVGLGGPGTYTDEFVDWTVISTICKGEGEITFSTMLRDMKRGELKKIYAGKIIEDLDLIPFPSRDLLKDKQGGNIFAYDREYKEGGSTILLTSRGCPFKCTFCSAPKFTYSKKVRYRGPENVKKEVEHVIQEYGIRQFRISDDMFTANRNRVLELCEYLGPLDIAWRISTRAKPIDYEMYKTMFDAGCQEVSFGIESFDNDVLKVLKKGTTAEDNAKALEIAHKVGMKTRVLFMIRTPGQTSETVKRNIEWLQRVPYDIICVTSFVPLPGSEIWENPDKFGIEILSRNLDDYNFYFFGSSGENELKDVIKIKDRSLDDFNEETQYFKDWIQATGRLNVG